MKILDKALEMHVFLVAVQHHRKNSLDVLSTAATFPQGLAKRRVVYTPLILGKKCQLMARFLLYSA